MSITGAAVDIVFTTMMLQLREKPLHWLSGLTLPRALTTRQEKLPWRGLPWLPVVPRALGRL
jgi:hypothetical protein